MEQNEDALELPALALCFIRRWSHKAYSQTGREDRQVVILYWRFRRLPPPPASL